MTDESAFFRLWLKLKVNVYACYLNPLQCCHSLLFIYSHHLLQECFIASILIIHSLLANEAICLSNIQKWRKCLIPKKLCFPGFASQQNATAKYLMNRCEILFHSEYRNTLNSSRARPHHSIHVMDRSCTALSSLQNNGALDFLTNNTTQIRSKKNDTLKKINRVFIMWIY